jgi:polysaccharide transporter, PST family
VNSFWIRYLPTFIFRHLDGRHSAQKVIANAGWLSADRIVRLAVGLFVGTWVARFLGRDQFGSLSYAVAFVGLLGAVTTLGLDGIVVRELVRHPERKNEILGTTFVAKTTGGFLTLLLSVTLIAILRPGDSVLQSVVGILAVGTIFQSFDTIDFWFQSRVESRLSVFARNSTFLMVAGFRVALILLQAPLFVFAVLLSLETCMASVGLVVAYKRSGQYLSAWKISGSRVRQLLREGWPVALTSMAVTVYMKIDQIMLGQMLGVREVGIYGAALRFSEVWYFIPVALVASVAPSLTNARKASPALYYARLEDLSRLLMGIALIIAIPMTFASAYLVRTFYGLGYEGAGPVLAIHIWAAPFVFLGVAQTPWTLNEGLTKLALARTASGAVVNVLLNLVLIPTHGAVGAAVATAISYALSGFVLNAFSRRTRRIFFLQLRAMIVVPTRR